MKMYEDDTDSFSQEYLDYLKTLTSEVFDGSIQITRNSLGHLVRMQIWIKRDPYDEIDPYVYYDFPFTDWMKPDTGICTNDTECTVHGPVFHTTTELDFDE